MCDRKESWVERKLCVIGTNKGLWGNCVMRRNQGLWETVCGKESGVVGKMCYKELRVVGKSEIRN